MRSSGPLNLKPLSYPSACLDFRLHSKARACVGIVGIIVAAYACLWPAAAEVEEDASQGIYGSGYTGPTLSNNRTENVFIGDASDEDVIKYLSTLGEARETETVHSNIETYIGSHPTFLPSKNSREPYDALVPETVWSLDASTDVHLDRIPGGPGSEIYTVFGGRPEIPDFWISTIFGSWGGNNTDNASGLLAPPQFQVASCGGSSAEHSHLDYCDNPTLIADQLDSKSSKSKQNNSDTTTQGANSDVVLSSGASAFNLSAPANIASFAPATADKPVLQGTLSLLGSCGDISASCAIVIIDPVETPIDLPAPDFSPSPIDDLILAIDPQQSDVPPPDLISNPDPGFVSPTSGSLSPNPRTIPEASTWVMTITGFTIMIFVFRKKRRPRINPISIIDVPGVY